MEVRICRASAVIIHRIPGDQEEWFLDWQRGVTAAAEAFSGYRGTDIYPATSLRPGVWVVVLHFDEDRSLQQWLDSPTRAEWVAKLTARIGTFDVTPLAGGFGVWFAEQSERGKPPPGWKMVATVLLALYPTVMLLTIFPGPFVQPLGFAVAMVIGNALSVSLLQYVVMPVLTRILRPWLAANLPEQRNFSLAGLGGILALLAILVIVFRLARIGEP